MNKPKELEVIEGIIINVAQYKDNDAIITLLSNNYKYAFKANGAMKPNSKLHLVTYIYSSVSLEVGGYTDNKDIHSVKLVKNRVSIYENLKMMTSLSIVQEIYLNLVSSEDKIDLSYLQAFLDFPSDATVSNMCFAAFVVLLQVLQDIGIFNKSLICTNCGEKHDDFSFYDMSQGGVICSNCAKEMMLYPSDKMKLTILKTAMKIKPSQLYGRQPPLGKLIELFDEVLNYLHESLGIKIKSYTNFKNWFLNL